jgi:hypothetical protein
MLMSVLGGMSESERQHVQARVRAAMDSQVLNEGRHQGGRAPCGYSVVDAGPHPNPRKAVEGFRLRVLAVDEPSAAVVRRIFAEYLDGNGDRAIAGGLNRDGVPCPSARRPDQNRHRLARRLAGQHGARDPRQSPVHGYAVFGRWTREERLANPDDVAAGHVTRFPAGRSGAGRSLAGAGAPGDRVRRDVHPVATAAPLSGRPVGLDARRRLEHGEHPAKHAYVLRGLIRCGYCVRKMEGTPKHGREYYRCVTRTLAPGSPALAHAPAHGSTSRSGRCFRR